MLIRKKQTIKNVVSLGVVLSSVLAMPQTAFAEDDCTDAKPLVKAMKAVFKADAALKDVIDPEFKLSIHSVDDNLDFSGLLYRHEGTEYRFEINDDDEVLDLEASVDKVSSKGELCILVDGKTVEDQEEPSGIASANFVFPYLNKTGSLTMDELVEGAKDGSKVMKSLAPGGLGFVVPKMKSIVLSPADTGGNIPRLTLMKNGKAVDVPEPVMLNSGQYFHLSDLKKTKADTLMISGDYNLHANFDFKDKEIKSAEAQRLEKIANPDASLEIDNDAGAETVTPE